MSHTNPLIAKWEELHVPKEEPKDIIINSPIIDLKTANKFTTYDVDSISQYFLQVAELLKKGEAKVISQTVEMDHYQHSGKTITFEVQV